VKPRLWFAKQTHQAVMARTSVLPVIARSGPRAKSNKEVKAKRGNEGVFIVGESEVGGADRVGGNPNECQ
jgi:hypothetical protein